jgi:hypothetical protein
MFEIGQKVKFAPSWVDWAIRALKLGLNPEEIVGISRREGVIIAEVAPNPDGAVYYVRVDGWSVDRAVQREFELVVVVSPERHLRAAE